MTKCAFVIYDAAVDSDVMAEVERICGEGYTKIREAYGVGGQGRKENNAIWPGMNNIIIVAADAEKIQGLADALRELQGQFPKRPGITIIVTDAVLM